jgi:very-short-patch-repair endonuclease
MMIVLSTAQQRLAHPDQLQRELDRSPRVRHREAMLGALADLRVGATSTNEADFLQECRRRGLPTPRMQRRRLANGRVRRTDAELTLADGRCVIVEIDGVGHLEADTWHADISRHNDLAVATGAIVLRVTGWEVRHDPDPFFDLLCSLHQQAA